MPKRSSRGPKAAVGPESPSFTSSANLLQRKCGCGGLAGPTGDCAECSKTTLAMQRRASDQQEPQSVPPVVDETLRASGQPLDAVTRAAMESRLRHDFGTVRVHTDARAADAASAVNALAYTVGQDVVFGQGRYEPGTEEGRKLLAHELVHVVQQSRHAGSQGAPLTMGSASHPLEREADRLAEGLPGRAAFTAMAGLVQRQEPKGGKKPAGGKTPEKKPEITLTLGQVRFDDDARKDILKGGALLVGADNAHIGLSADGRLGYDAGYTTPEDPFRWQKIRDLVDSGQKILIRKVGLGDTIQVRLIEKDKAQDVPWRLLEAGLTLPTESFQRKIYPTRTGVITASPSPDTHHLYYTTDLSDPDRSALPHELMGHMWLALKGVPFAHPKAPPDIATRGTLTAAHGITDPLGGVYTGPVKDFIDRYVGSEQFSRLKSPTQFAGRDLLAAAVTKLKAGFAAKATGTLNGPWEVPDDMGLVWETISTNYELAGLADPALQKSIVADLGTWYAGLSVDRQYVFLSFLSAARRDVTRKTKLASELVHTLKRPAEMRGGDE